MSKLKLDNAQFAKEFKRRKPSTDHWMNYSIGSSDCYISVTQLVNRNEINVCLYIPDNMAELSDRSKWKEQFDWLADVMVKIEKVFKKYL